MKNKLFIIYLLLFILFISGCESLWTENEEVCGDCIPVFRFELIGEHHNTRAAGSYRIDTLDADGRALHGEIADFLPPGKISLLLRDDSTFRIEYNSAPDSINEGNWTSLSEEKYESDFHLFAFAGDFRSEVFRQQEWYELMYLNGRKGAIRIVRWEWAPGYVEVYLLELDPFILNDTQFLRSGKIFLDDGRYPINNCCDIGGTFGGPAPYYGDCEDWYICDSRNQMQEW